ncbi:hypothetical protein MLD38_008250 [Melastoma candidum]|uniref:Uncharacterized protein n=1 Tax=Melastoma candidum TaxID=119954 RepID=A0ACB9RU95_9MYRT|nr:hypothetical protein MLD38_008250 [Melastoma candidum]
MLYGRAGTTTLREYHDAKGPGRPGQPVGSSSSSIMAEFKHLVVVKFKEGANVSELLKGMEDLTSGLDLVKSAEWGNDSEGQEFLTQGFTHAFLTTFRSKEDYAAFASDPKHLEFSPKFAIAIDKVIVLDFPANIMKSSAA